MSLSSTLRFVSIKDTIIKGTILTIAATVALMFGTVGQASAWDLRYENTLYTFSAQSGGLWCNFQYMFGEVWGVAYSKVKNVGGNTQCNFGVRAHTSGSTPAGGACWTVYPVDCNSSQLSQGWYQSQSVGNTQHHWTRVVVVMGQAPYRHYMDFHVNSNIYWYQNTSHGYTYDGNSARFCTWEPWLNSEEYYQCALI